jgi:hypothetical protein
MPTSLKLHGDVVQPTVGGQLGDVVVVVVVVAVGSVIGLQITHVTGPVGIEIPVEAPACPACPPATTIIAARATNREMSEPNAARVMLPVASLT